MFESRAQERTRKEFEELALRQLDGLYAAGLRLTLLPENGRSESPAPRSPASRGASRSFCAFTRCASGRPR